MSKLGLFTIMALIGTFTVYASANTYEVVARKDIPLSSVITTVQLTTDNNYNAQLKKSLGSTFNPGNFGIPKKIKFAETKQHIDIIPAFLNENGWMASKGLAQTFIVLDPIQKIFGNAVIYMRYNTPTTQYLGDVFTGDVINIVTTDGWQLGYRVNQTTSDPSLLDNSNSTKSRITVIMVDENSSKIEAFSASLTKVGERL